MPAENQVLAQLEALGRRIESTGAGDTPEPLRRSLAKRRFRRRVNAAVIGLACVALLSAGGYAVMLATAPQKGVITPGPIAGTGADGGATADPDLSLAAIQSPTAGAMRQHWAATGDLATGAAGSMPGAADPVRAGEYRGPEQVAEWFSGR